MACKPLIYAVNSSPVSVASNSLLPFTTVIRRRGSDIGLAGSSIAVASNGSNYYKITVDATFTAPVAGVVSLDLQQNGSLISGASASESITTPNTEARSMSFTAIVRTFNCCAIDSFTVLNSGVAALFSNIAISVEKI